MGRCDRNVLQWWPDIAGGHLLPVRRTPCRDPSPGLRGRRDRGWRRWLGFFSPHSWWPISVAAGAALFAGGFATGNLWFAIFSALVIIGTAAGMVFEYHVGPEKH